MPDHVDRFNMGCPDAYGVDSQMRVVMHLRVVINHGTAVDDDATTQSSLGSHNGPRHDGAALANDCARGDDCQGMHDGGQFEPSRQQATAQGLTNRVVAHCHNGMVRVNAVVAYIRRGAQHRQVPYD